MGTEKTRRTLSFEEEPFGTSDLWTVVTSSGRRFVLNVISDYNKTRLSVDNTLESSTHDSGSQNDDPKNFNFNSV